VLPDAKTLIEMCRREYGLILDAIKNQFQVRNKVSFAYDRWTSTTKLTIMSVIAYNKDRNWELRDGQLAFNEVDHLFYSGFLS
jgi:hypothetical protein